MKRCFELLGLDEAATIEQIMDAYMRKKALYSGAIFEEDPKYAKKKLAELEQAVREAYVLDETGNDELPEEEQLEALRQLLTEDEMHMQELYHKHLSGRINRMAGIPNKKRNAAQKKADAAYKGKILLFWICVVSVILLIGLIL